MTPHFEILTMSQEQVTFAIELAAIEGWNPGLHDAAAFYNSDPQGFFIGLLEGRPIGCISAVSYQETAGEQPFGFVGCYIVVPAYRGMGYGIQLWRHAMNYLAGHNVGLDGVVEQQTNYRKSGFHLAYRNIRYRGVASQAAPAGAALVSLDAIPFEDLCRYDRRFFPAQRREFLRGWITMPDATAFASLHDGAINGYGVIRQCLSGYKIGPLFADSAEIAERLYTHLATAVPAGSPIYLDVPEKNAAALALAARHQMSKAFETARMYTGAEPEVFVDGIYGVTTFELG